MRVSRAHLITVPFVIRKSRLPVGVARAVTESPSLPSSPLASPSLSATSNDTITSPKRRRSEGVGGASPSFSPDGCAAASGSGAGSVCVTSRSYSFSTSTIWSLRVTLAVGSVLLLSRGFSSSLIVATLFAGVPCDMYQMTKTENMAIAPRTIKGLRLRCRLTRVDGPGSSSGSPTTAAKSPNPSLFSLSALLFDALIPHPPH